MTDPGFVVIAAVCAGGVVVEDESVQPATSTPAIRSTRTVMTIPDNLLMMNCFDPYAIKKTDCCSLKGIISEIREKFFPV